MRYNSGMIAVGYQFLLQRSKNFPVFSTPEDSSRHIDARYARMTRIPRISIKFPKKIATSPLLFLTFPREIIAMLARAEIVENGGEISSVAYRRKLAFRAPSWRRLLLAQ